MATIDLATKLGAGIAPSVDSVKRPVNFAEVYIDFEEAATEKGSALAAADVIEAIDLPAGSVVFAAGIEVIDVNAGSTVLTLDLGVTGSDADAFVDGFDFVAATAGAYAAQPAAFQPIVIGATADTLDVLIASLTTTNTGGRIRVWALYGDVKKRPEPALAALRS